MMNALFFILCINGDVKYWIGCAKRTNNTFIVIDLSLHFWKHKTNWNK